MRPQEPPATPLPQGDEPPGGNTGDDDDLLEVAAEERIDIQEHLVPDPPSLQTPPSPPPSAAQIQVQMVATLGYTIARSQSTISYFREVYDTDELEGDILGMSHFLRTLPRDSRRALTQHQMMEVA